MGVDALISKMTLLIITITSDLTQIFVIFSRRPVTIVPSRKIGCIDLSRSGGALRPWTARVIITTAYFITLFIPIVFPRPVKGLGIFGILSRLGSRLLRLGKILFEYFFLSAFGCLQERSIALGIASIYFLDQRWKAESGFGLYGNGFFDNLLPDIFWITILIGLDTDR